MKKGRFFFLFVIRKLRFRRGFRLEICFLSFLLEERTGGGGLASVRNLRKKGRLKKKNNMHDTQPATNTGLLPCF